MLLYGAEAWSVNAVKHRCSCLGSVRDKSTAQDFFPVRVGDDYRIRTNRKLYEFFNDMDIAKRINNDSAGSPMSFGWIKAVL